MHALFDKTKMLLAVLTTAMRTSQRVVMLYGWEVAPLKPASGLGGVVSSPSGTGAEPRPKTNLVHSRAVRKPLVAIILSILK